MNSKHTGCRIIVRNTMENTKEPVDTVANSGVRRRVAAMVLALCSGTALAGTSMVDVSNARFRLLPGDLPLAGYFDMHNPGNGTVSLTGASSPAFGGVMIHMSMDESGQARMMMVDKIDLAPGKTIHFAPGGYHLMLMHRKQELKVGDMVPIELDFSNGHSVQVKFRVGGADLQ